MPATISKANAPKTVADAAKVLDQFKPGWETKIKVQDLNLGSLHNCILGQVYGVYGDGMLDLFGDGDKYYDVYLNDTQSPFAAGDLGATKRGQWEVEVKNRLSVTISAGELASLKRELEIANKMFADQKAKADALKDFAQAVKLGMKLNDSDMQDKYIDKILLTIG